jgi:hypothetical protein
MNENTNTGSLDNEKANQVIRNTRIEFRVTDDEKAKIEANSGNLSTASFLRDLGLRKRIKMHYVTLSPEQKACDRNLKAMGNNLNQMIRHIGTVYKQGVIDAELYVDLMSKFQTFAESHDHAVNLLASYKNVSEAT